jgi:hypothetical protein
MSRRGIEKGKIVKECKYRVEGERYRRVLRGGNYRVGKC